MVSGRSVSAEAHPIREGKATARETERAVQDREYTLALGAASYLLTRKIASATKDEKRAGKMRRVAYKKREHLKAQFDGEFAGLAPSALLKKIAADWDDSERLTFLIDLAFSDPFVPYAIDFKPRDLHAALRKIV
ncbi:MAG: hypothetical protein ACRDYV_15145, partial [Acidimicrobiia bacterium]